MADNATDTTSTNFESKLEKPEQRFLAHVIEHAFQVGRRLSSDFVRNFSARAVMSALERRPDLRADILVPATGVNHKVALRKSAESSGEDLQIALDEGVTTAEDIVKLFRPDDRVRYLDNQKLWSFITEGEFWKTDKSKGAAFDRAKQHVAFMLDRGLADGLLSHEDLIGGVSVDTIAQSLPRKKLGDIISAALAMGRDKKAFTERDLLGAAAAAVLVEDVSLLHIWETVIIPKIAVAHGFVEGKAEVAEAVAETRSAPVKVAAAKSSPVRVEVDPSSEPMRTKPAPGMPTKKTDLKEPGKPRVEAKKKDAKKPAKKAKSSSVVSGSVEVKGDEPKAPAGLEELLVDVDEFEIEEIEEEFSDQATSV